MLIPEPCAGAPDAADHLVDMQQQVVFLDNLLHPLPVSPGGHDDAAARRDRLQAERADGVGAFAQDDFLDGIGGAAAVILDVAPALIGLAIFKAVGDGDKTGRIGSVLRVAFLLAARRQAGDGRAVIVAVAVQDLVFLAAVMARRNLADHLESLLVGLGPRVGIIQPRQPRHLGHQLFGELRPGDRSGGLREIVHLDQLVADGIGDFHAAIADVDGPDAAGHGVQMLFALLVPDAHPLALDDDSRVVGFKRLVGQKMVPDVGAVRLDDGGHVVGGNVIHDFRSSR